MCGFIGRFRSKGASKALDAGLRFLARRGPDSNHYWLSRDGSVELIQARLGIVDANERSDQPFTCEALGTTVAFNGEIYNYAELRSEMKDFPFRTQSDTEVLLAVYGKWGVDGLKRLRGMFAACIVDANRREVLLVRDPVGKKPLYISRIAGGLSFCSSVLPLVALQNSDAWQLNETAKINYWRDGFVAPTESCIEGVTPVMPGDVLVFDLNGMLKCRTRCEPVRRQYASQTTDDVKERLRELLELSVARRMHNNPHPVCLLSGGVDSTVVALASNGVAETRALTLSAGPGMVVDRRYAAYAAKREGWALEFIGQRSGRIADDVDWALGLQDEPLGMISFFPLALLVRACKEKAKILLTGDGGDEVFCGYGVADEWQRQFKSAIAYGEHQLAVRSGPSCAEWVSDWGRYTMGYSLLGHNFTKVDRASAEQGVEVRSPLLDWDLMDFVRQLDPAEIFRRNTSKGLLKSYLDGWPDWFVERSKAGFTYRLRWFWGARRFDGLREGIGLETIDTFSQFLPAELRGSPRRWRSWSIFKNFPIVWKLLVWQKFLERLAIAGGK